MKKLFHLSMGLFVLAGGRAAAEDLALKKPGPAVAAKPVSTAAPAKESPCECAAKKKCWKNVMSFFRLNAQTSKDEIEKALPNRFFPDTLAWSLAHPDKDGHFLRVQCGDRRKACDEQTFELEKRLIISSLLKTLGEKHFDPETWVIDAKGYEIFDKLKQCRPGLLRELAAAAQDARPQ